MDLTYRPAKFEDLEEAERVVQGGQRVARTPWQAAVAGATSDFRNSASRRTPTVSGSRNMATRSLASASAG